MYEGNLERGTIRSGDEAREKGRKGGVKSGEVRRAKKAMRDAAILVLGLQPKFTAKDLAAFKKFGIDAEKEADIQLMSLLAQGIKAMKGDAAALQFLRDTAGEQPTTKIDAAHAHAFAGDFELVIGVGAGDADAAEDQGRSEPD